MLYNIHIFLTDGSDHGEKCMHNITTTTNNDNNISFIPLQQQQQQQQNVLSDLHGFNGKIEYTIKSRSHGIETNHILMFNAACCGKTNFACGTFFF